MVGVGRFHVTRDFPLGRFFVSVWVGVVLFVLSVSTIDNVDQVFHDCQCTSTHITCRNVACKGRGVVAVLFLLVVCGF